MKPQKARNIGAKKWWDSLPDSEKTIHSKKYFHTADFESLTDYSIGHIWSVETENNPSLKQKVVGKVNTDSEKAMQWWNLQTLATKATFGRAYFGVNYVGITDPKEIEYIWRKETQPSSIGKKGSILENEVRAAYTHIRKIDNTITDDVLDFMKDAAIAHTDLYNALKELLEVDYTSGTHLYCAQIKAKQALEKANPDYKCSLNLPKH